MQTITSISRFMGGNRILGSPCTEHDLIAMIRNGLPPSAVAAMAKSADMSEAEVYRSLRIVKPKAARLNPIESERLYRFARVMLAAMDVFGEREQAKAWLFADNIALNRERPIDLLDTHIGLSAALDVLSRIEFGVCS